MSDSGGFDVLVLGSAQYSDRSWVNCQEVAVRLAPAHRVLFVDSAGLRLPRARGGDLRRVVRRLADAAGGLRSAGEQLWVLSPAVPFSTLLRWSVRRALARLGIEPAAVIAYLPTWAPVVEMFPAARRIYHCVDAYAENPGVDRRRIEALEERLLRACDLVLAVSLPLHARLAARHPDVRLLPNVADVERFAAAGGGPLPPDLTTIPRPRLLYLGNLADYKVDLGRLERLARARPEWSWVLVGPAGRGDPHTDLGALARLPNVHLLGERERALAPGYVAGADACLLPLRSSPSTASSCPLKTWEYLAAGRPVVATPIPALDELATAGLLAVARSDEEWLAAIAAALVAGERGAEARRAEARQHGWAERMVELERLLDLRLPR